MSIDYTFDPHTHLFWSNTVDVYCQSQAGVEKSNPKKVGSFVTYGTIMATILSLFSSTTFDKISINGKTHYVSKENIEKCKSTFAKSESNKDFGTAFDTAIESMRQVKAKKANED